MRRLLCMTLALGLGACASGESNLEKFAAGIHAADGAAVVGSVWLVDRAERDWSERVVPQGEGRYRVAVARGPFSGMGEGDFARRFRAASERTCAGYRMLSYDERYEPAGLAGASRVAEGLIQCPTS